MLSNLITNRTREDVLYARNLISKLKSGALLTEQEQAEYAAGLRGCYNISDLNRVGEAMLYLKRALHNEGYAVNINPRVDWECSDILRESDWKEYFNAIQTIRDVIALPQSTPHVPDTLFANDSYNAANDIEKILIDIEYYVIEISKSHYYCGELYAGEI